MPDGGFGQGLRGDYSQARSDYTVDATSHAYSEADHEIWRKLYRRQTSQVARYACDEFIDALYALRLSDRIPQFDKVNGILTKATGWRIVAVPGLIPDDVFFAHLAKRQFPVTVWMRKPEELDYIVEPDLFHDFFGHVPLLFNPVFAGYMEAYGRKGPEALALNSVKLLARFYWYMVEFGLIRTNRGVRAFGAGMLSSHSELAYSVESPEPNRIRFDLERTMRTDYKIDSFQETYFVLDSFDELFAATERDFAPLYAAHREQPALPAATVLPTDTIIHKGRRAITPRAA
jgi:phenylalanine-4-hydroxylase